MRLSEILGARSEGSRGTLLCKARRGKILGPPAFSSIKFHKGKSRRRPMKNKISGMRNAYNFQKTATTCVLRENSNENKRLDQFAIELSVILL